MSALLIDDLMIDPELADGPVKRLRDAGCDAPSLASVSTLPTAARPRSVQGWRLTQRGIAVVLALFVGLFLTGVVVAVTGFLSVSDAPLPDRGADVAAISAQR